MSPKYNKMQQVFSLSDIAGAAFSRTGTAAELQAIAEKALKAILADAEIQELVGTWELTWGPVVYQAEHSSVADNTMYVARRTVAGKPTNEVVVAIAGTNPVSWYGWLVEDFMLSPLVPWPFGRAPAGLKPEIAHGTSVGLGILMNMESSGQTLLAYLGSLTLEGRPVDVSVAGHSLGGALTYVLSLALTDLQGESTSWDPHRRAVVSALPSAGPSPGNGDFAQYFIQRIGLRTNRVWNSIDVVANSWQPSQLRAAAHFYYPYIVPNVLVRTFLDLGVVNSRLAGDMTQVNPQTPGMPGQVSFSLMFTPKSPLTQIEIDVLNAVVQRIGERLHLPNFVITQVQHYIDEKITQVHQEIQTKGHSVLGEVLKKESEAKKGLSAAKVEGILGDLAAEVDGLLTYFFQAIYQHTSAYPELLGTNEFTLRSAEVSS